MRMYSSVSVLLVLVAMASAYAGGPSTGGKNFLLNLYDVLSHSIFLFMQ